MRNTLIWFWLLVGLSLTHCTPVGDGDWIDFYKAVTTRNVDGIIEFTSHNNRNLREQAWRALYNTEIKSDTLLQIILDSNDYFAWYALGRRTLTEESLTQLKLKWLDSNPHDRTYINHAIGLTGDSLSMVFLMNQYDKFSNKADEYEAALAVGRLMTRYKAEENAISKWIENGLSKRKPITQKAYFYGLYRGSKSNASPEDGVKIIEWWQNNRTIVDDEVAEMLLRVVGLTRISMLPEFMLTAIDESSPPFYKVQWAQTMHLYKRNNHYPALFDRILKDSNEMVLSVALGGIGKKEHYSSKVGKSLLNFRENGYQSDYVQLHTDLALTELSYDVEPASYYWNLLSEYPHWSATVMLVLNNLLTERELINDSIEMLAEKPTMVQMTILQAILKNWDRLSESDKLKFGGDLKTNLTEILNVNPDRGLLYVSGGLITKREIFDDSDLMVFVSILENSDPVADIEVYQALLYPLYQRLGDELYPLLLDLAEVNYPPLSAVINNIDPDFALTDTKVDIELKMPNFERIKPYLAGKTKMKFVTNRGDIVVELDALRNPATVSMIDSLARAGFYDGVPFHRVVPNFVIQTGDFERGDGLGGGKEMIPTEASELSYTRGSIGMASAGTDTESSQFFIMHIWRPHLDGRYTRFGEVIQGMNVVDRIIQGDSIIKVDIIEEL